MNKTKIKELTFKELCEMLPSTDGEKLPGYRMLTNSGREIFLRSRYEDAVITVYDNGFFTYEVDGMHTVQGVDRCSLTYESVDGIQVAIARSEYEDLPYSMVLESEGSDRIAHNREEQEAYHTSFHLDSDGNDWAEELRSPSIEDIIEKRELEKTELGHIETLYVAMKSLTDKQREVIELRFYQKKSVEEIAVILKLSRQSVYERLNAAIKKLKKFF
ncbi:RNA polymerase sigma factor [Streptococcus alactolyticus]|uniref:RNA polymerase sigma factor n=1 Tax=Streptococcus alactolyticus TaxID=29389 RepID=UPI003F9726D9